MERLSDDRVESSSEVWLGSGCWMSGLWELRGGAWPASVVVRMCRIVDEGASVTPLEVLGAEVLSGDDRPYGLG